MIKGLHVVRIARTGRETRWYVYAWRGGPCIFKTVGKARPRLGAEEFAKVQAALEEQHQPADKTLSALVRTWRPNSPEWQALSNSTQRTWGSALNRIEDKWGATPLALWNDPRMTAKIVAWRDSRASTARAADIGVMVLRALLEFGRLRGMVSVNAAAGIPTLYRNGERAEIIWTKEDIERFTACAEQLGCGHIVDGLRLAALTGLRREDLVTLTWDQVGAVRLRRLD